jgi:CubicO group peptidase (beta-lactamase class C family)
MIAASLVGVWAATRPAVVSYRWVPSTPAFTEHYFLVVSARPDGTLEAFVRNPEENAGAFMPTFALDPSKVAERDGTIALSAGDVGTLRFHRPTAEDLVWFYPLPTTTWEYAKPAWLDDGWRVATLADEGLRLPPIAALMNSIAADRTPAMRSQYIQSIAIARHGRLALDQYFYGFTAGTPHDVRSAGKSVTTLMTGRAIEDTQAFSPASRVLALLTQYAPVAHDDARKERMTVADLMTMASGLACDDNDDASPGNEGTMQSQPSGTNWYRYTLDLPMVSEPGTRALYCSASINLLGAIVRNETDIPLDVYFHDRFALPMQFGTYHMWMMPPPTNDAYMAGGDRFRPRDFLKFGQLILDGGRWDGVQVIDPQWIAASIVPRTAPEGEGDRYGYGWHLTSVAVDGRSYDVINAGGNGGQLMIVVPALDLAIMVTAGNYNQFPVWRQFLPEVVTAAVRSCSPPGERPGG